MNLVKVYIVQSLTTASNNLRLNSQQIEVVGLLRETIMNSENLGETLFKMKKSTVLSKLAIRLNEVYNFLTQGKVDFLKISEQFREHSRYLIRDLNQFLENVTPSDYNKAMDMINEIDRGEINIELINRELSDDDLLFRESNALKEEIIMQDDSDDSEGFSLNSLGSFDLSQARGILLAMTPTQRYILAALLLIVICLVSVVCLLFSGALF